MVKYMVLIVVIISLILLVNNSKDLYREFKSQASNGINRTNKLDSSIITEEDMTHLPEPVQNYLKYVGIIGTEKVNNFKAVIDGGLKTDKNKDFSNGEFSQYSFTDEVTRLFYIDLKMFGMPVYGLHSYSDGNAIMLIKVLGLIPVVDGKGPEMDEAETVTMFNDMCIMAPATLIDDRIQWETIDEKTVKAQFTNKGITISAILYFNEKGQLINFESNDRYCSPTGKTFEKVKWSTPLSNYKNINGFNLPTYGEAIWNFPEGDLCYAKLNIKNIEYNVDEFEPKR